MLLIGVGEMVELAATYFVAQRPAVDRRGQPHARARRGLRRALRRRRRSRSSELPARLPEFDIVHHRHRLDAADPRQGHDRARAQGAPAPPDVHRRLRRAARRGARSRRSSRTSSSTPSTTWARSCRRAPRAAAPPPPRPRPSSRAQVEAFRAWQRRARRGPGDRRAAPARRAVPRGRARAGAARASHAATTRPRCSRRSPRASPTSSCTTRRQALSRAGEREREQPACAPSRRSSRRRDADEPGRPMKASIATKLAAPRRAPEGDRRAAVRSRGRPTTSTSCRKLSQERAEIAPVVEAFGEYRKAEGDVAAAEEMARDPAMRDFAEDEMKAGRAAPGHARSGPAEHAAAARPQRRQEPLPRDPRRHRRRRERALRGRPLPHVHALRRAQPLAGRDRLRERRATPAATRKSSRASSGSGAYSQAQVRIRRPPRAARARPPRRRAASTPPPRRSR